MGQCHSALYCQIHYPAATLWVVYSFWFALLKGDGCFQALSFLFYSSHLQPLKSSPSHSWNLTSFTIVCCFPTCLALQGKGGSLRSSALLSGSSSDEETGMCEQSVTSGTGTWCQRACGFPLWYWTRCILGNVYNVLNSEEFSGIYVYCFYLTLQTQHYCFGNQSWTVLRT